MDTANVKVAFVLFANYNVLFRTPQIFTSLLKGPLYIYIERLDSRQSNSAVLNRRRLLKQIPYKIFFPSWPSQNFVGYLFCRWMLYLYLARAVMKKPPSLSCRVADCRLNSAVLATRHTGKQMGNKVTADIPLASTDKLQTCQLC